MKKASELTEQERKLLDAVLGSGWNSRADKQESKSSQSDEKITLEEANQTKQGWTPKTETQLRSMAGLTDQQKTEIEATNYALLVDAETLYPVSYIIKPSGEKQFVPTVLKGKDLTENQIKELVEKKRVHKGFVPYQTYAPVQSRLERAEELLRKCAQHLRVNIDGPFNLSKDIDEYFHQK